MERTSQKQLFQCPHVAWPIYLQKKNLGEGSLLLKTRIFMKKKSTGRGVYEFKSWLDKRVQWLSNINVTRRYGIIVDTLSKFTNEVRTNERANVS